jgi:Protein of unknown function (DUF998)
MIKEHLLARTCGGFAWIGVLFYFLVASILQFLRPDYSFTHTPLSFYLLGPYSGWLHAAFYALAIAITSLAIGCYIGTVRQARSAATLVLFILGATGVVVVAVASTNTSDTVTLHGSIHLLAAAVAFIATSVGMLVQSWRFGLDPVWRNRSRYALGLAIFEFLLLLIYALAHIPASGLMEKLTIMLILLWLTVVASWLSTTRTHAPIP